MRMEPIGRSQVRQNTERGQRRYERVTHHGHCFATRTACTNRVLCLIHQRSPPGGRRSMLDCCVSMGRATRLTHRERGGRCTVCHFASTRTHIQPPPHCCSLSLTLSRTKPNIPQPSQRPRQPVASEEGDRASLPRPVFKSNDLHPLLSLPFILSYATRNHPRSTAPPQQHHHTTPHHSTTWTAS